MKSASVNLRNEINRSYVLRALPKVRAEWNLNRYFNPDVSSTISEDTHGFDIDLFPIESVVEANRPSRGICKLVLNRHAELQTPYQATLKPKRYYPISLESKYKYWASPFQTTGTSFSSGQRPNVTVSYRNKAGSNVSAPANKVVIKLENSDVSPSSYSVAIRATPSSSPVTINNPPINSKGEIILYWGGSNWNATAPVGQTTIHSITLAATAMDTANSHLYVIEVSGRLELDISEDIISMNDSFTMSEADMLTPIGTLSSNTADIELSNNSGRWSIYNKNGPFYSMLDKNIKMTGGWEYTLPGGREYVQAFEMYTDEWSTSEDDAVSVSLVDDSRWLQEVKPNPSFMDSVSAQQAVWMLCDSVGFNKYKIGAKATSSLATLEVFWINGEQSVWEVLQEISRATQMAIYFDSEGYLNIRTRDEIFDKDRPVSATFRKESGGSELSNIETLEIQETYEPNKVKITYQPTSLYKINSSTTATEVVWEPEEGDIVLRANPLVRNLGQSEMSVRFSQSDANVWPYEGVMNIEGEFIKYSGKQYVWHDNRTPKTSIIRSHEEKETLDARSSGLPQHRGYFTGILNITERGAWGSEAKAHNIDISGWGTTRQFATGTLNDEPYGLMHNRSESTIRLRSVAGTDVNNYLYFHKGTSVGDRYYWMGTRFMITPNGGAHNRIGFFFNSPALGRGYHIEVRPDSKISASAPHTVYMYGRGPTGNNMYATSNQSIAEGVWYDLDIEFYSQGSNHIVEIRLDGRVIMVANIPTGTWQFAPTARFGLYARGDTHATFEYAYAFTNPKGIFKPELDFFSRVKGSWYTDQALRDFIFETREVTRKNKKKNRGKVKQRYNRRIFDEFGPIAHEVREFNVKFDAERPVREALLYSSNYDSSVDFDFVSGPFGATFCVANTTRGNAILRGEDKALLGEGGQQQFFVYGKTIQQREEESVTYEDPEAIRRRGEIELEITSKWIQNKQDAEALGDWITKNWSNAGSGLSLSVIGNPLVEIGDVVRVQYDHIDGVSDNYYVTEVSNAWEDGITTNLVLKRINL